MRVTGKVRLANEISNTKWFGMTVFIPKVELFSACENLCDI
jgi:hypothetical protein